ncbi:MAG: glycosyltransferase family 2 protein [Bacteroidota bacterium]
MELSVIILNYKVPKHLYLCLDSVISATKEINSEIIVIDNHSEDEGLAMVAKHFPSVKTIANSENHGFSKGNNIGIKQAKGEYICILNPDTIVAENTFVEALNFAREKEDLGALGVQLINGRGEFLPESKRNIPSPKVALQKLIGWSKNYYASHILPDEQQEVQILVGAFMLMQKKRYLEVGGLDETYFMYGEDIDLSYQFLRKNYQNYYLGQLKIIHFKGESTRKDKIYLDRFYGAMQLFYRKNFSLNKIADLLVSSGLWLAKHLRIIKIATTRKTDVDAIYFISKNEFIKEKLEKKLAKKVEMISFIRAKKKRFKQSMFILDAEEMSYTELVNFMHQNASTNYFRILPKNSSYIIGSDSTVEQGNVIEF